jgi:hypothetical protein
MFRGVRLAVVVPALDEEASIAEVVESFRRIAAVDEVVVVDNGSRDRTGERARSAGARVLNEPRPGYGSALRAGIGHVIERGAGLVALAEADGTFEAADLEQLLAGLGPEGLVLGSRHARLSGAMRIGNRAVARFLTACWPGSGASLTDVGCTLRLFTAETWARLGPGTSADGPEFSPQMMCEALRQGTGWREIPVRYRSRASGSSKHTGSALATLRTALRMLRAVVRKRLESRADAPRPAG